MNMLSQIIKVIINITCCNLIIESAFSKNSFHIIEYATTRSVNFLAC